ncbi:hypothetical protein [Bacillus sp. ISL-55]|uniref:hypothetical protein n=1 Tax=Bacillus sp. ISL-55 TaxID=2819134 RepID=UPI001BEBFCA8|nr:hypothetical protein [Bacillus sp. ISL-55]MBT2693725.1 hypothetical protein [Bacillus sp. ISL-55]
MLVPIFLILILIGGGIFYWYFLAPPATFPDQEEIKAVFSDSYNKVDIAEIQDTIFLDEKHVHIPFITEDESYGISFWEWQKHEWQLSSFSTGSMPLIWKIDANDPSSHYILWNFHPENDLKYLSFFLIKERGFSVSDGKHQYDPGIQMDYREKVGEKSYGYSSIPSDWQEFIQAEINRMEEMKPNGLFADFFPPAQYYFGWQSTSTDGNNEYPSYPNTNGFGSGGSSTEYLRFLSEDEIFIR